MTSIQNHKQATVLVAIAALAGVLVVSTSAIGSGQFALGANDIVTHFNNTLTYIQTQIKSKTVILLVEALEFQAHALHPPRTRLLKAAAFITSNSKKDHRTQTYTPY
jgi:hypothetical protein